MSVRLVATDRAIDRAGAEPAPTAARIRNRSASMEDDRSVPLPRNLLVGLHAVAADIALVREGHQTDPPLCTTLDQVLSRLDGLVDGIYDMAATSAAPAAHETSRRGRRTREASHARS